MSFGSDSPFGGPPRPQEPQRPSNPSGKKASPLTLTIFAVVILVAVFVFLSNFYADILWFNQLGFSEVYWTERIAKLVIFLIALVLMAVPMWFSMRSAYKHRPVYAPNSNRPDSMSRYQAQLEPVRRFLMVGIPLVIGIFAAVAVAGQWQTILLFFNQVGFGSTDPQFNMDLGFFVFSLPFIALVNGFLISVVLLSGVAGLLTHYLYGGIRVEERGGITVGKAARVHTAVVVGIFLLFQAVNFWIGQYETLTDQSGRVAGALYKDVHAVIPAQMILAIVAILIAITFVIAAINGRWRLPLIGTAMLVATMIVASGVYPFLVQQYKVVPSQKALESEYIERNIEMTRLAFGLDDVEVTDYDAKISTEKNALAKETATTANIRLLDPNLVSAAFAQLQQFRGYYTFAETLNVDRYEIDGKVEDTVIAAREVNVDPTDTWVNQHINYTHGYGLVAAYGNRVAAGGRPDFMLGGIPTSGDLITDKEYEPRIYFGENSPSYSIVGGPDEGWTDQELDRPGTGGENQDTRYTFKGDGGPNVGNLFNRLVYALKFASTDLLLSQNVNSESQILYDRDPRDRVSKVAPYLTLDSQAYPAIVDGRVQWIIDGYTTSNDFPYSQQQQLDSAVTDSLTNAQDLSLTGRVNYLRNSVKATVDAYDGSVKLYAWDTEDPILQSWQKIFPTALNPLDDMSAELMEHVRYPEDMFKVQREVLTTYHVDNPDAFYESNDAWAVPDDPTSSAAGVKQPPYFMSLKMPTQDEASFSLTSTFIPAAAANGQQRNVLFGFLSANADAGSTPGEKADDYGKLRLLELPRDTAVPGPGQAQQNFDTNTRVTTELNLLRQGASEVKNGNLLSLPVGGGILYVQPVYVQSSGQTSYPTLRKVLVSFGDKVGFADTLAEALDEVFGGDSGAVTGETEGVSPSEDPEGEAEPTQTDTEKLTEALADANEAIKNGQEALANGDFGAYGESQKQLEDALNRAMEADAAINGTAVEGDVKLDEGQNNDASQSPAPTDGAEG
ncbi:UPF0182 family protein [Glutamicibacter nicotianae]|uniref:UPF0182 protein ANI01nite_12480 n=1 Tax=Glutamicibacter nicotianae TaxID=37929 RepID=A0ABQ0RKJ7_GLUNI|nr:UPF0182 family protein [Glutamicibacter nicotianae]GEC12045.1 UPF0182 protein [Glutamicibacter nicotianae]